MPEEFSERELRSLSEEAEQLEQTTPRLEITAEDAAAAADPIGVFCGQVWPVLRPILHFVLRIPFIRGGLKETIRQIIRICDGLCQRR